MRLNRPLPSATPRPSIQILGDLQSFGVSVRGEKTGHPVIRQMNSIRTLVDENCHWRVRARIWHMLHHGTHNDGIAYDQTQTPPSFCSTPLAQDPTEVHTRKLHQFRGAGRFTDDLFHFWQRIRRAQIPGKHPNIGAPDSRLDHGYDIVEPPGRSDAESLNLEFFRCHPASPFKRTDMTGRLPLMCVLFLTLLLVGVLTDEPATEE
jgi:hypothetical protein